VRGNADDGADIGGYNLNPAYASLTPTYLMTNVPGAETSYKTWEITATKRMSSKWSAMASFAETWSRSFGQINSNQVVEVPAQSHLVSGPGDVVDRMPEGLAGSFGGSTKRCSSQQARRVERRQRRIPVVHDQRDLGAGDLGLHELRQRSHPGGTDGHAPAGQHCRVRHPRGEGDEIAARRHRVVVSGSHNITNANPVQNMTWSPAARSAAHRHVPLRVARLGAKVTF
jgi:hypothetical protein